MWKDPLYPPFDVGSSIRYKGIRQIEVMFLLVNLSTEIIDNRVISTNSLTLLQPTILGH